MKDNITYYLNAETYLTLMILSILYLTRKLVTTKIYIVNFMKDQEKEKEKEKKKKKEKVEIESFLILKQV